jgi:sporulation protein YlmC with PRC-barrel domain
VQDPNAVHERSSRLLVSAEINLGFKQSAKSVQVRRGMPILTAEGLEVGRVAAVVVSGEDSQVTHLLLGRLPNIPDYRLVSIDLIAQIREGGLQLSILSQDIDNLLLWHSPE